MSCSLGDGEELPSTLPACCTLLLQCVTTVLLQRGQTGSPPKLPCSLVDDGVELLSTLRSLTQLNLQECWQVTDRGLEHLSGGPPFLLTFWLTCFPG